MVQDLGCSEILWGIEDVYKMNISQLDTIVNSCRVICGRECLDTERKLGYNVYGLRRIYTRSLR